MRREREEGVETGKKIKEKRRKRCTERERQTDRHITKKIYVF